MVDANVMSFDEFREMMGELRPIAAAVGKRIAPSDEGEESDLREASG